MADNMSSTQRLVSHIGRFRDDPWDEMVLSRTKLCLLDSLGCYSAGISLPHFTQAAAAAHSSFIASGEDQQPSPFVTAYLYGQGANALDYDDTIHGHPGSPIIGAVIALGAAKRVTLDRILRGIAAGYEVHWMLCEAAKPSAQQASFVRSIGVFDTIAATMGALVALDLDEEQLARAIGVALPHSILPYIAKWYERPVPAMKNNMGWIASGAVLSANLTIAGQTGITAPLDGATGMWRMAGSDSWALEEVPLNKPAVLRTGFKRYPACWHTQEHLKALSDLLNTLKAEDDVLGIVVSGPPDVEKFCETELLGAADIAFSLPALFGRIVARVEPGPLWDRLDFAKQGFEFRYVRSDSSTLEVRTRSGQVKSVPVASHSPSDLAESGLSDTEVVEKFNRLADPELRAIILPMLERNHPLDVPDVVERLNRFIARSISEVCNVGVAA